MPTLGYPDATSWAQARSASESPRLGMLESYAFQAFPAAVAAFGDDGEALSRILGHREPRPVESAVTWIVGTLAVIGVIAPVAGSGPSMLGPVASGLVTMNRAPLAMSRIALVIASKE